MLVGRTLLFVPGDRPDRIGRAVGSAADAVAVDLEDAAVAQAGPRDGLFLRVNALDGPDFADDPNGLVRASVLARELGFTGKVVLHPRQLEPVREAFAPTADELDRARAVLDAAEAAGGGACRLPDGTFVDAPVVRRAAALLGRDR